MSIFVAHEEKRFVSECGRLKSLREALCRNRDAGVK
jgi:hypothetical protein